MMKKFVVDEGFSSSIKSVGLQSQNCKGNCEHANWELMGERKKEWGKWVLKNMNKLDYIAGRKNLGESFVAVGNTVHGN